MIRFLKDWTLPLAMLVGTLCYLLFSSVDSLEPVVRCFRGAVGYLTPMLIFTMLYLTFCKVKVNDMRFRMWHLWLLLVQLVGSLVVYACIAPLNNIVAQAAMVCIICPTATAAVVITQKLGGGAASLTTYTLLSNLLAAVCVPILFPLVNEGVEVGFLAFFTKLFARIFPLLIVPFLLAWLTQTFFKRLAAVMVKQKDLAFYLWAVSLAIVTGETVKSLVESTAEVGVELWIAFAALVVCCLQFVVGKTIGSRYGERIGAGQALGQKNTILAIWMAYSFLNPLASVGPGSYVLWQNIINSWQLWRKSRREAKL